MELFKGLVLQATTASARRQGVIYRRQDAPTEAWREGSGRPLSDTAFPSQSYAEEEEEGGLSYTTRDTSMLRGRNSPRPTAGIRGGGISQRDGVSSCESRNTPTYTSALVSLLTLMQRPGARMMINKQHFGWGGTHGGLDGEEG